MILPLLIIIIMIIIIIIMIIIVIIILRVRAIGPSRRKRHRAQTVDNTIGTNTITIVIL